MKLHCTLWQGARLMASTISELLTVEPVVEPRLMLIVSAPRATASSIAFT